MRFGKPSFVETLVLTSTVGILVGLLLPCSDFDITPRYPSSAAAGVPLVEQAGNYSEGYRRGCNRFLSLLPDGRYSYVAKGCTGVHHRESGHARIVEGHLVLTPEKANTERVPRDLLPIRWDERSYLIPADKIPDFCDAVIAGTEPRNDGPGFYFASNLGRAEGFPEIPSPWLAYLKARLTFGKMIEVDGASRVKIALGSKQGLKVGEMLRIQGEYSAWLRVTAVEGDSCLAESLDSHANPDVLKPGRSVIFDRPETPYPEQ
jgi:hypothetical protein